MNSPQTHSVKHYLLYFQGVLQLMLTLQAARTYSSLNSNFVILYGRCSQCNFATQNYNRSATPKTCTSINAYPKITSFLFYFPKCRFYFTDFADSVLPFLLIQLFRNRRCKITHYSYTKAPLSKNLFNTVFTVI